MGVLVGALIISGISYALWSTTKEQKSVNKISSGCLKLSVQEGQNINIENAYQTPDSEGLQRPGYNFTINNNCNHEEYVEVNLDIKNNNTLDAKNIRATLLYSNQKIIEPNNLNNLLDRETTSKEYNTGKHLTTVRIKANSNKILNLKIWLDENTSYDDLKENNTFESKIEINSIKKENILASDYIRIISEDNNQLAYDETVDNNLRYVGADPNNYVDFNGEKWRIIGVMNNIDDGTGKKESRVKLIKNEDIGKIAWDAKPINNQYTICIHNNHANCTYKSNWKEASLKITLNEAYWNSTKTTEKNNLEKRINGNLDSQWEYLDFTNTGIKTINQKLVDKAIYYLGKVSASKYYIASMYYELERTNNFLENWTGYIGLMYPSDYGYATSGSVSKSRNECLKYNLYEWNTSTADCVKNDWLLDSSSNQWTITPSDSSQRAVSISADGHVINDAIVLDTYRNVRPVLYLKSSVKITSGDGSKDNAFKLSL